MSPTPGTFCEASLREGVWNIPDDLYAFDNDQYRFRVVIEGMPDDVFLTGNCGNRAWSVLRYWSIGREH